MTVRLDDRQRAAFVAAKQALASATHLAHPSQGFQLSLHIGGALHQWQHTAAPWQPLGFFSRKLDSTQIKYSAFDRELLAGFVGIWTAHTGDGYLLKKERIDYSECAR